MSQTCNAHSSTVTDFIWGTRSSFKTLEEKVAQAIGEEDHAIGGDGESKASDVESIKIPEGPLQPPESRYGSPPPIGPDGNYERIAKVSANEEPDKVPDFRKSSRPRGHDRYNQVDGPLDPQDIHNATRREDGEEMEGDENWLAKESLDDSASASLASAGKTGDVADDEQKLLMRDAEAAEARTGTTGSPSFGYKRQSQHPPPEIAEPVAAVQSEPPAEPKKITMPEAQRGVFVPGEIEPWQTRMYNPKFHQ